MTHAPRALLHDHIRDHGGELGVLVPALRRQLPDLPPPASADADTGRYLLFAAVAGLLCAAAQNSALVIVMDDCSGPTNPACCCSST